MKAQILSALNRWNPEVQLTVKARFIQKGNDNPLTSQQYTARLYDKDLFGDDDYLGQARLDENGEAHIHFYPTDIVNHDLGFEELPDLYLLLFKGDVVHFQTKVWDNVDFSKATGFNLQEGEVVNFGTFLVD